MLGDDPYLTPAGIGEAVLVEKKSKFIALACPATTVEEAMERIGTLRKEHADANHVVYAYRLHHGSARCSDDGEPRGTAGPPILGILEVGGIADACCMVVRYYGGVLLGTGGLIRAYAAVANQALSAAGIQRMDVWQAVRCHINYSLLNSVKRAVSMAEGVIESIDYGVDVDLKAVIPVRTLEDFDAVVRDLSAGRFAPEYGDRIRRGVPV